ncbi:MAG: DUF167 domain-containing protein [Negativicutes bacterium]|nr:DUF167 domain-containing protein [Negativicutes bacterium]
MGLETLDCRESAGEITVKVRVQPRASRNAISGISGDSLRLALTSPPVEGAANAACIEFFAELCSVAKSQIAIAAGQKSREKVIRIRGINKAVFFALLAKRYSFD